MPETDLVLAGREEQRGANSGGEVVSLPTHTALSPHHQRVDQDFPADNVASNIQELDKNHVPESDLVSDGRVEQNVVKPGGELISLPTHTAPSPCAYHDKPSELELMHWVEEKYGAAAAAELQHVWIQTAVLTADEAVASPTLAGTPRAHCPEGPWVVRSRPSVT